MKKLKQYLASLFRGDICETATNEWLDIKDEFVEFPVEAFDEYKEYDQINPNRFEVRYDKNFNRIWHKESKLSSFSNEDRFSMQKANNQ